MSVEIKLEEKYPIRHYFHHDSEKVGSKKLGIERSVSGLVVVADDVVTHHDIVSRC